MGLGGGPLADEVAQFRLAVPKLMIARVFLFPLRILEECEVVRLAVFPAAADDAGGAGISVWAGGVGVFDHLALANGRDVELESSGVHGAGWLGLCVRLKPAAFVHLVLAVDEERGGVAEFVIVTQVESIEGKPRRRLIFKGDIHQLMLVV